MIKKICYTLLFIISALTLPPAGWAANVQISASVDKQTAYLNEEVYLSIRINGGKGNIAAPQIPHLNAFDAFYSGRASQYSFINGQSQSTTEFNYVLIPKASGVFSVGPIEVQIEGQVYRTQPIQIEVLGQATPASAQPQPAPAYVLPNVPSSAPPAAVQPISAPTPSSEYDPNIFVRVQASKRQLYSNEQMVLTYSLLTRYDTRYEGFSEEPQTSGFWVEEFPMEREIEKRNEIVNGKKYLRADVKKVALFPTAPGEYVIKPGALKASVQIDQRPNSFLDEFFSDSFFSNAGLFARRVDKILTADPITITVKPLPEKGKPESFSGAVGQFKISSSIDKRAVKQNEPVALTVIIEGEGNIETLTHPAIPVLDDVKVYDSDAKSEFYRVKDLIAGKKTFEIILIPKSAGTLKIPALPFSYFNPQAEQYVTLSTPEYVIQVEKSAEAPVIPVSAAAGLPATPQKDVELLGRDIRYIHERLNLPSHQTKSPMFFLGAMAIGLSGIFAFLLWRTREVEAWDVRRSVMRQRYAKRTAYKSLHQLKRLMKKKTSEEHHQFFDEAERLMNQYLADQLNLSPHGLTLPVIEEQLIHRQVPGDMIKSIENFYETCGFIRYAKSEAFMASAQEMMGQIERILKEKI